MPAAPADFLAHIENVIYNGDRFDALETLSLLGVYASHGLVSERRFNRLRKVIRQRFPEA